MTWHVDKPFKSKRYPTHGVEDIVWSTWRQVAGVEAHRLDLANQVDKRVTLPSYMDANEGMRCVTEFDDYETAGYSHVADLD